MSGQTPENGHEPQPSGQEPPKQNLESETNAQDVPNQPESPKETKNLQQEESHESSQDFKETPQASTDAGDTHQDKKEEATSHQADPQRARAEAQAASAYQKLSQTQRHPSYERISDRNGRAGKHQQASQMHAQEAPKHKKRRRKQFPWIAIVLLLCFAISAFGGVAFYRNLLVPVNANDNSVVELEIPSGTAVSAMGDLLEQEGIIRSSLSFDMLVRLKGAAGNLQAGVHALSPSMTVSQVIDKLQEGAKETGLSKISVQEGLTVDQIGDAIGDSTSFSKEDFMNLMTNQEFLAQLVNEYPFLEDSYNATGVRYVLEGYLFPATYEFKEDDGLESLVRQMLDKTQSVLEKYQTQIDASNYNLQDIMSIASLVEKEGGTGKDRKIIAGVFYNRLAQDMPIQSDISVLYALNTHKEMVTYEDLEVDSPYNLYKNTGLPPGPMNNPSEESIQAALEPEASDYLYFYANIKTGEVFYTDSYEQHQKWQQEYEETGDIKK